MAAALTPLRIWLKDLFVLLLSMVPIAENRLAIPVAAALRFKWQQAFLCTTAGSFLPVPYVMKGSGPLADRARRVGFVERGLGRVERFAQKHPGLFRNGSVFILAVFVGIPFTGIGVWIASFVAGALGFDRRSSMAAILVGTVISGLFTTACTYGVIVGVKTLFRCVTRAA